MIVYKDKTFCRRRDCKRYATCHRNFDEAVEEKSHSPSAVVRKMGISVAEFEHCYEELAVQEELKYD